MNSFFRFEYFKFFGGILFFQFFTRRNLFRSFNSFVSIFTHFLVIFYCFHLCNAVKRMIFFVLIEFCFHFYEKRISYSKVNYFRWKVWQRKKWFIGFSFLSLWNENILKELLKSFSTLQLFYPFEFIWSQIKCFFHCWKILVLCFQSHFDLFVLFFSVFRCLNCWNFYETKAKF